MIGPKTFTNYSFQAAIWFTVAVAVVMIIAGSIDLLFGFKWGFSQKDILMSFVVLVGAVVVKLIGTKIITTFGGGF